MDRLTGIHAVKEALEAQRPIERIAIAKGRQDTRVEEIVQLARKQGVPVRFEDRGQLDRLANSKDHQGVVALAAARFLRPACPAAPLLWRCARSAAALQAL